MLGPGRYLLGALEIAALAGFATLGAWSIRRRWLPRLSGAAAALAIAVITLALLIWSAEFLGSLGAWTAGAYLALVAIIGLGLFAFGRAAGPEASTPVGRVAPGEGVRTPSPATPSPGDRTRPPSPDVPNPARPSLDVPTLVALAIALIAVLHFAAGVKSRLSTGMTGFDSTWYHGPFAAGFFQSGDTWSLHLIAPQFLAWFYPANGELFHAAGMLAFGRDLLSPLLNLGWFVGCLFACWCIGRPYRVGAWSLALGAIALSVPALADQAGEARNDIVAIFFLLAAVALALNLRAAAERDGFTVPELALVGLAAGLAAGTKLNYLLPAAILVLGLVAFAPAGRRWRALAAAGLGSLAGGGYWYLRNLAHSGNPLPWVHHLGPISLPAPAQALGGREAHSVLSYLNEGSVWSVWFLPGLRHGLWIVWPLLGLAALAGLVFALVSLRTAGTDAREGRTGSLSARLANRDWALPLAGLAGLAGGLAWLVAPTSASGPQGMPRGFESGLRYLAPALILGLALLPAAPMLRSRLTAITARTRVRLSFGPHRDTKDIRTPRPAVSRPLLALVAALAFVVAVAVGYPIQRHYLRNRYADPSFSSPGLDAAFRWARSIRDARIATTSTRQYPLFGTDLSNRVQYVGEERPHGGFEAPKTCRQWRRELNAGHYDYVVTTRDRVESGQSPYPPTTHWTESPQAKIVLKKAPTVVFELTGRLDPSACRR